MKKVISFLRALLPHAVIVLSLVLLTFFVIDRFNEAMAFLNNSLTKLLCCLHAVLSLCLAVEAVLEHSKK